MSQAPNLNKLYRNKLTQKVEVEMKQKHLSLRFWLSVILEAITRLNSDSL